MKSVRVVAGLGFGLCLSIAGCTDKTRHAPPQAPPKPVLKQAPATPIEKKKEELGGATWDPRWDAVIEKALPAEMLSHTAARAVRNECPRFGQEPPADKRQFWAYVFQALAGAEAGLDPTTDVHHTAAAVNVIDKVTGRPVRQEGLLQLTYEDSRRYGCSFDWQHDRRLPAKDPARTILQPDKNLECGLKIMENQVVTKHEPLVDRRSYWSTLQPGTVSYQVFAKQMANVPKACGLGQVREKRHAKRGGEARTH